MVVTEVPSDIRPLSYSRKKETHLTNQIMMNIQQLNISKLSYKGRTMSDNYQICVALYYITLWVERKVYWGDKTARLLLGPENSEWWGKPCQF